MLVPLTPQSPERSEREEAVTTHFCNFLGVSRGDAQALLETYPQVLDKAFALHLTPEEVTAIWQAITCYRDPTMKGPALVLETIKLSGSAPDLPPFAAVPVEALLNVARQLEASASGARDTAVQFGSDVTVERAAPFELWPAEASVAEVVVWTNAGIVLKSWWANGRADAEISTTALPINVLECMNTVGHQAALYWGSKQANELVMRAFAQRDKQHAIGAPSHENNPGTDLLCSLSAEVSLSEIASPYVREEFKPEWEWLQKNATLVAPGMPQSSSWKVLLDLSVEPVGAPLLLRDVLGQARRQHLRFLLISED